MVPPMPEIYEALHRYGTSHSTILTDEDISSTIKTHLQEKAKDGYIRAQDIVDFVSTLRTAQRWLKYFGWRYGKIKKGMYIDGHEREDVVQYRKEFLVRWSEYEKRMVTYDSETGEPNNILQGFPIGNRRPFRLILFEDPKAQPKGDGQSIMVSEHSVQSRSST